MAELKDKTLEQVNAGSNWIDKHKKQIEEWESHSKSPTKEISDPLLPGADIPDELKDKILEQVNGGDTCTPAYRIDDELLRRYINGEITEEEYHELSNRVLYNK